MAIGPCRPGPAARRAVPARRGVVPHRATVPVVPCRWRARAWPPAQGTPRGPFGRAVPLDGHGRAVPPAGVLEASCRARDDDGVWRLEKPTAAETRDRERGGDLAGHDESLGAGAGAGTRSSGRWGRRPSSSLPGPTSLGLGPARRAHSQGGARGLGAGSGAGEVPGRPVGSCRCRGWGSRGGGCGPATLRRAVAASGCGGWGGCGRVGAWGVGC